MPGTPDLIILNGKLITFDEDAPFAEALAVTGGVISAVGTTAEVKGLAGPQTRVVDAGGATVLPGFIDSHVHLFGGSVELAALDLTDVRGEEALIAKVRPYAEANPDDPLIFAVQADYAMMGSGRKTTRHDLDRVLPDRPLAVFAPDHHTIWANTPALELAGLMQGGEVDQGAQIVMGEDGLATGELQEAGAYGPILTFTRHAGRELMGMSTGASPVPAPTPEQRRIDKEAIVQGLKHCAAQGITGLHNMDGNFYQLELLGELEEAGDLLCRTEVPFHYKSFDPIDRFEEAEEMRSRWQSEMLWCNRVKMFMDGVVESGTALMLRPYPGTDHVGDAVFDVETFNAACVRADAMGLQIAVHAIGDLAVRRTLDGYELAQQTNGKRDSRHRVEHIEVIHPDDIPRFAKLGVVASIQPGHAPFGHYFHPDFSTPIFHDDQIPYAYDWRDIRESGAKVCFSTDWPVIPIDVTTNIKSAIAPRPMPAPWRDQSQGLMETLKSYTADNAWLEFAEDRRGKLKPGMMADIAVMTHDLEAMEPSQIDRAGCNLTVCGGRITHEA
ncbi:amidohydrolase family protein [Aquicoccus sp. SCR17]|nr:amidohydrolase family protein [Carideicomes alvinocaridis]